jgi:hypothetical protein
MCTNFSLDKADDFIEADRVDSESNHLLHFIPTHGKLNRDSDYQVREPQQNLVKKGE